jgi:hypothetical protein
MGDSTVGDVLQTLGPFIRDHFRRDIRFQDSLEVVISKFYSIDIYVGRIGTHPETELVSGGTPPLAIFSATILGPLTPSPGMFKLYVDLMSFIPREHVVSLKTFHFYEVPEEMLAAMPNIRTLWIYGFVLTNGFLRPNPDGPHSNASLLPSLQHLHLTDAFEGSH